MTQTTNRDRCIAAAGFSLAISEIARLLQRAAKPELKKRRLTVTQTRALVYIAKNEGCRQVDLARLLDLKSTSLGNVIDRLVQVDLVRREVGLPDRRAFRLYLGKHAAAELDLISELSERQRNQALHDLSPVQLQTLLSTLDQVRQNLKRTHKTFGCVIA